MLLVNLGTQIGSYEANDGSTTIFDYRNGADPLKNTQVNNYLEHDGADLKFVGTTGKQEQNITGKFLDGSTAQVDAAKAQAGGDMQSQINLYHANQDQFHTLNDQFKATSHTIGDAFSSPIFNKLMQLNTQIGSYEANDGSTTIFDYRNGADPLKNTKVNNYLEHDGADLKFVGTTGKQEQNITGKFLDGSTAQVDAAKQQAGGDMQSQINLYHANQDQFHTLNDQFKATSHSLSDAFSSPIFHLMIWDCFGPVQTLE